MRFVGLAIAFYMIYATGKVVWSNYLLGQQIQQLKQEVAVLEAERQLLELQIQYYHTESFQELQARRTLLLKEPDEHVIYLPK